MVESKGEARMYYEDDEGNLHAIECEGEPTVTGPFEIDIDNLPSEETRRFLKELPKKVFTASASFYLVPKPLLQPGTPFSYN